MAINFVPDGDGRTPCVQCRTCDTFACAIAAKNDLATVVIADLVAGGVVGGVLGHQIGSGRGNTVATIAGAGAGAYAGHQVEKNVKKKTTWNVAIRMDGGNVRTFTYSSQPTVREGERVKLVDGGKRLALVQ